MSNKTSHNALPYGLLELDATGTVLHYEPVKEQNSGVRASDIVGRNFFTDVAPVEQVREFQSRFYAFMANGEATQRFALCVPANNTDVHVQIVLARINGHAAQGRERLALVRIVP